MRGKTPGFTLLEMLIVLMIVGVLGSVTLPKYTKMIEQARRTEAIVNLRYIRTAEEIYLMEHGTYTKEIDELGLHNPNEYSKKLFEYSVTRANSAAVKIRAKRNKTQGGNGKDTYTINEFWEIVGP